MIRPQRLGDHHGDISSSQAGALAHGGFLPAVHSFACFLSTRPNEQIYNNATEGTKVIYAGSLTGLAG